MTARTHTGVKDAARAAGQILALAGAERAMMAGPDAPPSASCAVVRASETLPGLASRIGSVRAQRQNRLAEVYHMMLQGLRHQAPTVFEIVPARSEGAPPPDHGRLWAEYFAGGRICVLGPDARPVDWPDDRPLWRQADPSSVQALHAATLSLPAPSMIVDCGSGASRHQQNAFLALFPRLKSGGFYIIEGLRNQPRDIERAGDCRSADLFRGFVETRRFALDDADATAALNALAPMISGVLMLQAGLDRMRRDNAVVIQKV